MTINNNKIPIPPLMRTIVYGATMGSYALRTEVTVPTVTQKNPILVRVHAVGLNPVDAKSVIGDKLPHWDSLRTFVYDHAVKGHIPGIDFAGTVVMNHATTESSFLSVGTAVFGTIPPLQGTLAEYIAVPADQVWKMPLSSSSSTSTARDFVHAAALPLVGLTALQCLQPHLQTRPSVLVLGASGGTGHVMLQMAQCLGAAHVTAVCSAANAEFCRQCGATDVIDYHDSLIEKLRAAPGCPFDFVMDCVTSEDSRDTMVHYPTLLQNKNQEPPLLSPNYVYRRLGGPTSDWFRASLQRVLTGGAGGTKGSFFWWKLGQRRRTSEQLFWVRFPESARELQQLAEWVQQGKLKAAVQEVNEFSEQGVQSAMNALLSRRVRGKVVVQIYPPLSEQEV